MKVKIAILMVLSLLSAGFKSVNNKEVTTLNETQEYETTFVGSSPHMKVGDIDVALKDNKRLYTAYNIEISKRIKKPVIYLNIYYYDRYDNRNTIYDNYDAGYHSNHKLSKFFGTIDIPFFMLAKDVTIYTEATLISPRTKVKFEINISNPLYTHSILQGSKKRIYTGFIKNCHEPFTRSYFKEYSFNEGLNYNFNEYYYNHFNFNKHLVFNTKDPFSVSEPYFYIYDDRTTYFNNATYTRPDFDNNFHFFTLLATQDFSTGNYHFVFGKEYFVNPVTNLMSDTKLDNYLPVEDKIFLPLKHYDEFKDSKFGIILKAEAGLIKYDLSYEFNVHFENNYYKNEFVIYKNIIKTTKDPTLNEVIL